MFFRKFINNVKSLKGNNVLLENCGKRRPTTLKLVLDLYLLTEKAKQ